MRMIINAKLRESIMRSYVGGQLSCTGLLDMLENKISFGALPSRNILLRILSGADSHFNRRAHTEGSADQRMHYTIFIDNRGYHLRLDPKGIVCQITDYRKKDLAQIPSFVAPGAHYEPK